MPRAHRLGFCGLGFRWREGFRVQCNSVTDLSARAHTYIYTPKGPKVAPFGGSYLEFYKVIPKRNYFGAFGYTHKLTLIIWGHDPTTVVECPCKDQCPTGGCIGQQVQQGYIRHRYSVPGFPSIPFIIRVRSFLIFM